MDTSTVGSDRELRARLVTELRVSDLAASIAFYRQAGFEVERATATFAALTFAGGYLLLAQAPGATAGPTPPNIRLIVEDVDGRFAEAVRHGWTLAYPLADRGYGLRDFTVRDPDGYEIRFASVLRH